MIIVVQTVPSTLELLQELIGPERAQRMFFTSSAENAINRVRQEEPKGDRTVVISSAVFDGDPYGGASLATAVKRVDPTAWFFIFSALPQVNNNVDGVIDKSFGDNPYAQVIELITLNFDEIPNLEELHRRLPWLK